VAASPRPQIRQLDAALDVRVVTPVVFGSPDKPPIKLEDDIGRCKPATERQPQPTRILHIIL
jgi:hypothetical protein